MQYFSTAEYLLENLSHTNRSLWRYWYDPIAVPNPLLLAVIQEQLQGSVRPVVHVVFGSKELIQPGYQFTHQDEVH